mmetsp:Transcript_7933/g.17759  ORF Transcript_7933/g.17759 Transcript_7933/m.17759 type:complete len:402 (-) Transcript_7933:604-1809(-)
MEARHRPKDTPFRQQTMKVWRPILTPTLTIAMYTCLGVVFMAIGIAIISASDSVKEVESVDYGSSCCVKNCEDSDPWKRVERNPCNVTLTVTETMKKPVYLYYKMTGYFQNHRRYVKSRNVIQLWGGEPTLEGNCGVDGDEDDCPSLLCDNKRVAVNGCTKENASKCIINPCGLIAWSYFNDTLELLGGHAISEKGIAWETDIDMKFNNNLDGKTGTNFAPFFHERQQTCSSALLSADKQALCTAANLPDAGLCFPGSGFCAEDEHFIVWMRTAALPTFRKLYAKIDEDLLPGTYTVRVSNGEFSPHYPSYYNPALSAGFYKDPSITPVNQTFLYPVHSFGGTKTLVLSTTSWLGGKNGFLGWAYLVVGVVCVVLALAFAIKLRLSPRSPGTAFFVANKNK